MSEYQRKQFMNLAKSKQMRIAYVGTPYEVKDLITIFALEA